MRKILAVICVLAAASLTAPAAAAASACNDDIDNDEDGATDEGDSGCSPPYRLDDSEQKVWDTDATSKFDGNNYNDPDASVSLKIPGALKNGQGTTKKDSGSPLKEGYILGPGDGSTGKYGQGSLVKEEVSESWDIRNTGFLGFFGSEEYVDPPRDGDCGDGTDDGEDATNCPTDLGMAEDDGDSTESISEATGHYEIGSSDSNDILIEEASGNYDCDMDGNCPTNYDLDNTKGFPDFYIKDNNHDSLMRVDEAPSTSQVEIGEVTDYDLTTKYVSDVNKNTGSVGPTSCDGGSNGICDPSTGGSYCTTTSSGNSVDDWSLNDRETTLSVDTNHYELSSNGYGFDIVENDGGSLVINVDYQTADKAGSVTPEFCDYNEVTTYTCSVDNASKPNTCSLSGSVDTHTEIPDGTSYKDKSSGTKEFHYDDLNDAKNNWGRSEELNLNNGNDDVKDAIAGEYEKTVHHKTDNDGKGYFSVQVDMDTKAMPNDPGVGRSTFDIEMDGNHFAAETTDSEYYDADGTNALGDGLVAYHQGEGVVGDSTDFGPYFSKEDVENKLSCPGDYTKCVAAVDVSVRNFDEWDSYNQPGSGDGSMTIVRRAGLGEGLSACKMYQNLNSGGEEVQCTYEHGTSPLPYGPYTDEPGEFKGVFAGPEADTSRNTENPVFAEHQISQNQCVFNGTTYDEGSLKDIGAEVTLASGDGKLESGGHNLDQEVCLNMDGDNRGEWHDLDKTSVNDYVTSKSFSVSTGESVDSVVSSNPDSSANPNTGVVDQGGSLEDDCHSSLNCGDNGPPHFVPFYEGAVTADYNPFESGGDVDGDGEMERQVDLQEWQNNHPVPVSVSSITGEVGPPSDAGSPPDGVEGGMTRGVQSAQEAEGVHNTVDTSGGDEHGSGTDQSQETDLNLEPLENSRIDPQDDEWGISPDLSYVIDNFGKSYATGECYGEGRDQGNDLNKKQRIYANSYANDSSGGGEWVDPDATVRTINRGGITCDLTGRDWGIAYDTLIASELLPEAGGRMPEDKGLTFVGKGKLIPPETGGSGGGTVGGGGTGGVPSGDLCIGGGCEITEGSPTDRDDDTFVDEEGDNMSGTLVTPKLQLQDDLCVGSKCDMDPHIESDGLGVDNTKGDQLDLVVPNITTGSGDMCIGSTTEC